MQLNRFVLGPYGTNCYLIHGTEEGKCLLVDPADAGARLVRQLESMGLVPEAVLLTHGHYDHILAVPELQKRWSDLPVYCHPFDIPKEKTEYDMGQVFPTVAAFSNVLPLQEGQTLCLMGLEIKVLHTPGHTPGSVTFQVGDVLFTGDTLFYESIGRTDFAGGDIEQMSRSLARLRDLAGDWHVLPGHDSPTVMSHERKNNPYLQMLPL